MPGGKKIRRLIPLLAPPAVLGLMLALAPMKFLRQIEYVTVDWRFQARAPSDPPADPRIAVALRRMHGDAERSWTVDGLAREAGMSRSAFFERFARTVGVRPMEYLLTWRMAVAKDLLRSGRIAMDEVARRVGYGSASTFSTAFSRREGMPPGRFMRDASASP